jgi:alpha-amylase/alpha-mannosidase (GH57 family)
MKKLFSRAIIYSLWSLVLILLLILMPGGQTVNAKASKPLEPLYVAFIWNQHQPLYKDPLKGEYQLPWVRLHGSKDYYQMAAYLKTYPNIHQTFNLTPSLILQIQDYAQGAQDQYRKLSGIEPKKLQNEDKNFILKHFFSVPRAAKTGRILELENQVTTHQELNPQELLDLQLLFNLAWIDPSLIKADARLSALKRRDRNFNLKNKNYVLDYQAKIMQAILSLHKTLARKGKLELIITPYYHPILPLLINSQCALRCTPEAPMPNVIFAHPEDAVAQVQKAQKQHRDVFGTTAKGLWPSEEAVSEETIPLLARQNLSWIVTDESILSKTLQVPLRGKTRVPTKEESSRLYVTGTASSELLHPEILYQPYKVTIQNQSLTVLFRDEYLSDLIGFEYSKYTGEKAAQDLLARLHHIKETLKGSQPHLVTLALDGENAWEFYPEEKEVFFKTLYENLNHNPEIKLVTVSEYLKAHPPVNTLTHLATGSWNMGNLERWIGSPSKNKVWELLTEVRKTLITEQNKVDSTNKNKAWEAFYAAEGSDFPWWLDSQPYEQAEPFDELFRLHLSNVYKFMKLEVPAFLKESILKKP